MKTKCGTSQSLIDISIIETGTVEGLLDLSIINDISITDNLFNGQELEFNDIIKKDVVKSLSVASAKPATAIFSDAPTALGGIGFMAIEVDFIVS